VQMSQPAKAVQCVEPRFVSNINLKWSYDPRLDEVSRQVKAAMVNLAGELGISQTQIRWNQQQAIRRTPGIPPPICRTGAQAPAQAARSLPQGDIPQKRIKPASHGSHYTLVRRPSLPTRQEPTASTQESESIFGRNGA